MKPIRDRVGVGVARIGMLAPAPTGIPDPTLPAR